MQLGVTGTYYNTKATKRDEMNAWSYQNREGKALDGIWGYKFAAAIMNLTSALRSILSSDRLTFLTPQRQPNSYLSRFSCLLNYDTV